MGQAGYIQIWDKSEPTCDLRAVRMAAVASTRAIKLFSPSVVTCTGSLPPPIRSACACRRGKGFQGLSAPAPAPAPAHSKHRSQVSQQQERGSALSTAGLATAHRSQSWTAAAVKPATEPRRQVYRSLASLVRGIGYAAAILKPVVRCKLVRPSYLLSRRQFVGTRNHCSSNKPFRKCCQPAAVSRSWMNRISKLLQVSHQDKKQTCSCQLS